MITMICDGCGSRITERHKDAKYTMEGPSMPGGCAYKSQVFVNVFDGDYCRECLWDLFVGLVNERNDSTKKRKK